MRVDDDLSVMSMLIQEAGEYASSAIEARDSAKDELGKVEAVVSDRLRQESKSEARIKSELPMAKEIQDAQVIYNLAKLDADLWKNLCDSLRGKSSSLRVVADLVQAGFFTPNFILDKRRQAIRDVSKKD
jgi:hypothetical protein